MSESAESRAPPCKRTIVRIRRHQKSRVFSFVAKRCRSVTSEPVMYSYAKVSLAMLRYRILTFEAGTLYLHCVVSTLLRRVLTRQIDGTHGTK